jgi:hypothetical protein
MNDETSELNQADEDMLNYDVSDETLEGAATSKTAARSMYLYTTPCQCP